MNKKELEQYNKTSEEKHIYIAANSQTGEIIAQNAFYKHLIKEVKATIDNKYLIVYIYSKNIITGEMKYVYGNEVRKLKKRLKEK